jgi:hypothetical protein
MPFPTPKELTQTTSYRFTVSADTFEQVKAYLSRVKLDINEAGLLLRKALKGVNLKTLTPEKFIQYIINTKKPKNFAEVILASPECRKASGYSDSDLEILACIGTVMPSYAHNNGGHYKTFKNYAIPLPCLMGYVSAPLFTQDKGSLDDAMLSHHLVVDTTHYNREIEKRLLPILIEMNSQASAFGKKLKVTIPGLGCGLFAGPYGDQGNRSIYSDLNHALKELIKNHAAELTHIEGIYFDTYMGVIEAESMDISGIKYQCVASSRQSGEQTQLELNAEERQNSEIMLGTIVAADLLSWAGNDMWANSRATDEGVKGGSTLTLVQITCSLCPARYQLDDFKYVASAGAYYHKNMKWSDIADHLKDYHYASDDSGLFIHAFRAVKLDDVDNANYANNAEAPTQDESKNHTFNYKLFIELSIIGLAALVISALVLTALYTTALGMGVGMLAGATYYYGFFNARSNAGSGTTNNQDNIPESP